MLYITFSDDHYHLANPGGGRAVSVHVGTPTPNFPVKFVEQVQADGDELTVIAEMYPSLVAQGKRVVRFYGDIARTILLNWPWQAR